MRQITHLLQGNRIYQPMFNPASGKWQLVATDTAGKILRSLSADEFNFKEQAITKLNEMHMQGMLKEDNGE